MSIDPRGETAKKGDAVILMQPLRKMQAKNQEKRASDDPGAASNLPLAPQSENDFAGAARAADSRTRCTAASNNPIRIAMIAMTTSISMSVKARRRALQLYDRGLQIAMFDSVSAPPVPQNVPTISHQPEV